MQRTVRPEGLVLPSPQPQRNRSSPGDRTPSISGSSLLPPPSVSPDPAYIAASAASQIVNSDRADRGLGLSEEVGENGTSDTAVVSTGSLVLLNAFLDQLLFSFLASSRSTSIASLRPAILEILKPKLGKEAIDGADDELQGYLAGGDAEELLAFHSGQEFRGEYNLNLIWRRTRLRCMVYTRLGDMEEDDEDIYFEQEQEAGAHDEQPRLTRDLGSVSPAAAIFLTSILEFIGEQALLVAGEAAYIRMQMKQPPGANHRAVVEEVDMEKLAFNTTLGRLWRSWKKRVRSSSLLSPRPMSRDTQRSTANSISPGDSVGTRPSTSEGNGSGYFNTIRNPSVAEVLHEDHESAPSNQRKTDDLPDEPDFSGFSAGTPSPEANRGRPRSMIDYRRATNESPAHSPTRSQAPNTLGFVGNEGRPSQRRQRSSSMPAGQTPYVTPTNETFTTPTEGPDPFVRENDRADAEKEMPKLTDDARTVSDRSQAVTTMYDGAISQGVETLPDDRAEWDDRGVSTSSKSSNYTDEYNHEMTPQALRLHKPGKVVLKQIRNSRDSTRSSNYSFLVGELNPVGHPGEEARSPVGKENETRGVAFSERSNHKNQPSTDGDQLSAGINNGHATLQDRQSRAHDESRAATKRDDAVLYAARSNGDFLRSPEATPHARAEAQDEGEVKTTTKAEHHLADIPQGVPPLSPLRELIDAAHDTSDEASSSAISYDAAKTESFVPTHRYRGSGNSSTFNQGPPPTSASRSISLRSQAATANTGTEKAAVQRVSPSTSTPRSAAARTSTSSNRDGRPMTAGSTTSQMSSKIKGIIGRESGDVVRQPMANRNSSERSVTRTSNKEQDFEELIKSAETVRYTLTPQNMREIEVRSRHFSAQMQLLTFFKKPDSPRWQDPSHSETAELADFLRTSAPASAELDHPATSRSVTKLKGLNGLRSNPINNTSPTTSSPEMSKAPPRSVPRSPGPRSPGAIARDPTTKEESVRDFADFIRSTGPDPAPTHSPNPVASNPARISRPGSSSSPSVGAGKTAPKKITKQSPVVVPKRSDAQLPRRTSSKLQAREPTVGNNNATADLADFFRSEPVRNQTVGSPPPPRSGPADLRIINPNAITNGKNREAVNSGSSVASTQDSFAPSKLTQSSANSRTGLLDSSNRAPPAAASSSKNRNQMSARNDDPPGAARKQRRNRDPYSIDSDSENEDGHETPQATPERQEESLSDFLRNYHPPPDATTVRGSPPTISGAPKPAKQASPTIRERLARNIAVVPDYRPLPPKTPKKPSNSKSSPRSNESHSSIRSSESARRQTANRGFSPQNQNNIIRGRSSTNTNTSTTTAPQLPPINPRATSPQLVSQTGTKVDSHRSIQPTDAKRVDRGSRRPLQARQELDGLGRPMLGGGMGDLADFLRETEPPAPSGPVGGTRPMSPVKEKKERGLGRMFGRR